MSVADKSTVTDSTRVADLTVGELRALVREVVDEALSDHDDYGPDPDFGLELRPEFEEELRKSLARPRGEGISTEQMMRELGLDA